MSAPLVGLVAANTFGSGIISIALAVGISIALMQLLRITHAPAGANPILIIMSGTHDYSFLLTPILTGSILLVMVGLLINNIGTKNRWPCYWLGIRPPKNKFTNLKETQNDFSQQG